MVASPEEIFPAIQAKAGGVDGADRVMAAPAGGACRAMPDDNIVYLRRVSAVIKYFPDTIVPAAI
jgi:hypothetical protein